MKESEEELRRRIGALTDAELVRMLTVEADERPVPELRAARAVARARSLDPDALGEDPRADLPTADPQLAPSIAMTAVFDARRLASLWPWALILPAGLALEVWIVRGGKLESTEARLALLAGSLTGFGFYLRAVHRVHVLLREATGGRFPISPGAAVGMHFVPVVGFFWGFDWGSKVSRFAELNGDGQRIDRYVPGLLFLAAYGAGYYDGFVRLVLLFVAVWYLQFRLRRSLAHAQLETTAGDWSSGAPH